MSQELCEVVTVNDFQYENLIKAVELCMKENYCALYFEDLVDKFCPEISEEALRVAIRTMDARGKIRVDDTLLRLVIRCSVHRLTAGSYINSHVGNFIKKQGSNYGFAL
ncbi:MAG: hypothetical protein WA816_13095, partial [Bacteroidales bacterium]